MRPARIILPLSILPVLLVATACTEPATEAMVASPPAAATAAAFVGPPTGEASWRRKSDGSVLVSPDNFIRAESDLYMAGQVAQGALGKFVHTREMAPIDDQPIIRLNRDTLYSAAIFNLDAGPVTVTLPDPGERFLSMLVINQDHYNPGVYYGAGTHTLTRELVGTRYVMVGIRILANPDDPADLRAVQALQDAITSTQPGGPGTFEAPKWDMASQKKVRAALLSLNETLPDLRYAAGMPGQVDPVRRLVAAAAGWGLNPDKDAIYLNVVPERNDGRTAHVLEVGEVPVDAFWSVSVYNEEGYYQANPLNAYVINSVTAKRGDDGSVRIQFGDCGQETANCLPIVKGWNYMVRLYKPREAILENRWTFPVATPIG